MLCFLEYFLCDSGIVRIHPQHRLADIDRRYEPFTLQVAERQLESHGCRCLELQLECLLVTIGCHLVIGFLIVVGVVVVGGGDGVVVSITVIGNGSGVVIIVGGTTVWMLSVLMLLL